LDDKFGEFIDKVQKKEIKKEDVTDEQLNDLETIITLEKSYAEQLKKEGELTPENYQKSIDGLNSMRQGIQKTREERANPSNTTDPNNNQNDNNQKPIFGDTPVNLPTDVGTPPTPKNNQNGPSDNSKNDKNDNSDPKKDNSPDSTNQQDKKKIEESKNIEEARENAKKILTQIFQNTAVKISDLDQNL